MLFNSFPFLLMFLPVTWTGWWLLRQQFGSRVAWTWLIVASVVFYGGWNLKDLPLYLCGLAFNYAMGRGVLAARSRGRPGLGWLICNFGVAVDIAAIVYFKYAAFFSANLAALTGVDLGAKAQPLPLGISFITFQLIGYVVDCARGATTDTRLRNYLVFITFFPHLIAGPIAQHGPIVEQVERPQSPGWIARCWPPGLLLFALGLFKKVVVADSLARYASPVFQAAEHGLVGAGPAWTGMLSYTLQLYFDFSGYSEMAIGLGLMFGLCLPVNFVSPYRAGSIIEFWRRWHMTLSRLLRDYVYIPLGGARRGQGRRYFNVFFTMVLCGLWHGAGWTFVLWGVMHGVAVMANHGWRALLARFPALQSVMVRVPHVAWVAATFLLVALLWVMFRADTLAGAANMYRSLLALPPLGQRPTLDLAGFLGVAPAMAWAWIALGLAAVWFVPSRVAALGYDASPSSIETLSRSSARSVLSGALAAGLLLVAMQWLATAPPGEFLYFRF